MCVAGEEEPGGSVGGGGGGSIPEIVVTAPRIGINIDVFQAIDWDEVGKLSAVGAFGGAVSGGWWGLIGGAATGAAAAIESQPNIDLEDLFQIKNDMVLIPGVPGGYLPLY